MALSFVGYHGAAATSVATVNQVGDLLIVCAFRSGSVTPPTIPGTFFDAMGVAPANGGGGTNNSCVVGYRFATAINEGSGTWANATSVMVQVWRGAATGGPINNFAEDSTNSASTSITYPARSFITPTATLAAFGMRTTTGAIAAVANPPTDMTFAGSTPATPYTSAHYQIGRTTNWPATTVTVGGTSVKSIGVVLELLAQPTPPVLSSPTVTNITSSGGTAEVTSDTSGGLLHATLLPDGSTQPSAAQIAAGQDSSGATALDHKAQVPTAGVNSFAGGEFVGLSAGTAYDVYYVQEQPAGVFSNIVKADFTTSAGATQVEMTGGVSGSGAPAGTANARIAVSGSISSTGSASGAVATRIAIVGNTSSSGSTQGAIAALIAIAGAVSSAGSSTGALSTVVSITGQVNGSGALTGIVVRLQPLQGQSSGSGLTAATLYKLINLIGSVTGLGVAVAAFEEEGDFITGAVIGVGTAAAALSTVQPISGATQGAASLDAEIERILGLAGSAEGSGLTAADLSAVLTLLGHVFAVSEVTGDLSNISGIVIEIPPCPSIVEVDPSQNVVMLDPSINAIDILQSVTNVDLICLTSEEEEALANG